MDVWKVKQVGAAAFGRVVARSACLLNDDGHLLFNFVTAFAEQKLRPLARTPKLPEEFVKKQKAYFADVDAFELAEEEVSESELE